MGSEHGNVSNDNIKHVETKHEDDKPLLEPNSSHFSFSSSSSSSSSSAIEFDIDDKIEPVKVVSSAKSAPEEDLTSSPESVSPPEPTTPQWSLVSASQLSSSFGEASSSQMKSPESQSMARPPGYDPNRIPASVFTTKQSNLDWSTASNESLFSIHMGNNSFTREHAAWLEEWNNGQISTPSGPESKSTELNILPPVIEVPGHEESSVRSGRVSLLEKEDSDRSLKSPSMEENNVMEKIAPVKTVHIAIANGPGLKGSPTASEANRNSTGSSHRTSYSNPRLSDESGHSSSSFAFPVLVNESVKGSSSKMNIEKPPVKPEEKKKEQTAQTQVNEETTPKPSETRCFSCIPWFPRCC